MRDHMMGYPPATSPDFNGLACEYNRWWGEPMPADACGQRAPRRRYIGLTHMTKSDHAGRERDLQAGRLEAVVSYSGYMERAKVMPVLCGTAGVVGLDDAEIEAELAAALKRLREAEQHAMFAAEVEAKQAQASAHARSMGERHQQRMLKLQAEVRACVGMQPGDSGWRDWNDG
jgi:hypothetical protein